MTIARITFQLYFKKSNPWPFLIGVDQYIQGMQTDISPTVRWPPDVNHVSWSKPNSSNKVLSAYGQPLTSLRGAENIA